nr:hypothetical protein [Rhodococcus sp. (in: high G+C Gram-positive bacteria)]
MRALIPLAILSIVVVVGYFIVTYYATPEDKRPELPLHIRYFGSVAVLLVALLAVLGVSYLVYTISGQL